MVACRLKVCIHSTSGFPKDSGVLTLFPPVEGRLYTESMTGATAKSKPKATKLDEKELSRLRKQDYWLQVTRAKLIMDMIFVCELIDGRGFKRANFDFLMRPFPQHTKYST